MTNLLTTFPGYDRLHEEQMTVSDENSPRYCRDSATTMSSHSPVLGARRKETEIPSEKRMDGNAMLCREEYEASSHTKATASDSKDCTESSFDSSTSSPLHHADWEIPRWKALEAKRLALCRKRVQLERRLFESTLSNPCVSSPLQNDASIPSSGTPQPRTRLESCTFATPSGPIVEWSGTVDERTGLPTGHGKMVYADGQIYEGYCRDGLRHGIGRNAWPSSSPTTPQVYTGEWVQGHREGRGTHCWPDGRTVTGNWKKGHLNGRVFFSWPDGASYDGEVVNGIRQGRGTHTWADGRVYSGQYQDGYEHGVGMLTEANLGNEMHSQYRGQFQHGARHGYGIQIWPTKMYDGEWSNNVVHGTGKLTWTETGASYTGQFSEGVYHGAGSYSSPGGRSKYTGQWRFGSKEGSGKRQWSDGRCYEGSFQDNKPCGYGRMTYSDGAEYTGGWKDGKRSGWGIAIVSIGMKVLHCGMWSDDKPVRSKHGNDRSDIDRALTEDGCATKRMIADTSGASLKLRI